MRDLGAAGTVAPPIRTSVAGVRSRPWLRQAESLFTSVVAYLAVSPLLSRVLGRATPGGQLASWSHDGVGSVLLVVLPLFVFVHIVGRSSLHPRARAVGLACLRRIGLGATAVLVALLGYHFSRALGVGMLVVTVGTLECVARDRRHTARALDLVLTALYAAVLAIAPTRGPVLLVAVVLMVLLIGREAVGFARQVPRRGDKGVSRWGALSIAFTCAMLPLSLLLHTGPMAGSYGKPFSPYRILHVVTATGFIIALVGHIRSTGRKMAAGYATRVFSLPTFLAGLLAISVWQLGAAAVLRRQYTPPARTTGRAVRVSPYTRVQGYTQNKWEESLLQPTKSCGRELCHAEVTQQHEISAHGRAFTNDTFQFQLAQFIREKGREAADYCIACHAPLGVIAHPGGVGGVMQLDDMMREPLFAAGITCVVCHRATPETDRERLGIASLTIRPLGLEDNRYVGEEDPGGDELHRRLIELDPELHRRTYHIDRQAADAVCAACHVVILPGNLSVDGQDHLVADHYLSFVDSPYGRAGLTCASCHQPRFENYRDSYSMVDHHYLGSGSSLPYRDASADERFRAVSMTFLHGLGDISLEASDSAALPACIGTLSATQANSATLRQRAPENRFAGLTSKAQRRDLLRVKIDSVESTGDAVVVQVSTTNECVGHIFPSGGGIKAYLEVLVFDDVGQIAGRYGGLNSDGEPVETATRLGVETVDSDGNPVRARRFWAAARVTYRKEILPGDTIHDEIRLPIAPGTHAARVEGTWYYLRPERLRNRERGIQRDIPPVAIGSAEWRPEATGRGSVQVSARR